LAQVKLILYGQAADVARALLSKSSDINGLEDSTEMQQFA